jgi:hypothetical protein
MKLFYILKNKKAFHKTNSKPPSPKVNRPWWKYEKDRILLTLPCIIKVNFSEAWDLNLLCWEHFLKDRTKKMVSSAIWIVLLKELLKRIIGRRNPTFVTSFSSLPRTLPCGQFQL